MMTSLVIADDTRARDRVVRLLIESGLLSVTSSGIAESQMLLNPFDFQIVVLVMPPGEAKLEIVRNIRLTQGHSRMSVLYDELTLSEASKLRQMGVVKLISADTPDADLVKQIIPNAWWSSYGSSEAREFDDESDVDVSAGDISPDAPLVLLLGDVAYDGVISSLRTGGRQYKKSYCCQVQRTGDPFWGILKITRCPPL